MIVRLRTIIEAKDPEFADADDEFSEIFRTALSECLASFVLTRTVQGSFDSVTASLRGAVTPLRMTLFRFTERPRSESPFSIYGVTQEDGLLLSLPARAVFGYFYDDADRA
jgi:hypothetical protein